MVRSVERADSALPEYNINRYKTSNERPYLYSLEVACAMCAFGYKNSNALQYSNRDYFYYGAEK